MMFEHDMVFVDENINATEGQFERLQRLLGGGKD